ncbi:MAG: IclR family transcriptional regulator [Burkholderiaceae bacterium]|nr:IclR family transcriptional regulator [Burkholderiaceae bacterium]
MNVKARSAGNRVKSAPTAKSAYEGPRSPVRVMQIVETLAEAPQGMSLTQLAARLEIPKTSLLNHLRVMAGAGHVALKDAAYVLGPAAIRLGIIIAAAASPMAAIGPVVRELAETSGETALCGMLDESTLEVVYVEVFEGRQQIRYSPPAGTRRPLYCSGMGRALLAFQPESFIDHYLGDVKLERVNANTVTSRARQKKLLSQTRADRFAISLGERIEDLGAIGSPIFDRGGRVQYAIGVAAPVTRLAPASKRLTQLVLAAAQRASWALGV